jgi:hypothetical protein
VFIACRFQEGDREVIKWFEEKVNMYGLATILGNKDKRNSPPIDKILSQIQSSDILLAIVTNPPSLWVQNEIGMAYALGKKIIAFYEKGIDDNRGFYPFISDYIEFSRDNLDEITDSTNRLINSCLRNLDSSISSPPVDKDSIKLFDQDHMTKILPNEIQKSGSMDIWAYTSETFLNAACHEALIKNKKLKIRILIRDPDTDERKKPMALASLDFLKKLNLSNVEIKFYNDVPLTRAIIFDNLRGYVGFYRWDPKTYFQFIGAENNSLAYISNESIFGKLWLELYRSRFEFEWNRSKIITFRRVSKNPSIESIVYY